MRTKNIFKAILILAPFVLLVTLRAWVEDTVKTGEACIYCHVNASGIGPLTPQGLYYAEHGTLEGWDDSMLDEYSTDKIDFDARIVTMVEIEEEPAFSLMTAKLSARFPLGANSHIYINNNLGEFRRAYLYSEIANIQTTVGIIETDFGLRIYDHTSLLEDELGFGIDRIDIGANASYNLGFVNLSASVLNGAYPVPFRADPSGISAYTAKIIVSPWDFVSTSVSAYHNTDDDGGFEKTLFAGMLELRKGRLMYSGEHILGRWREKLVRGYHNSFYYSIGKGFTASASAEMLDLDRDISESADFRGQLGLQYKINKHISTYVTYSHLWKQEENIDRWDIYFIGDY